MPLENLGEPERTDTLMRALRDAQRRIDELEGLLDFYRKSLQESWEQDGEGGGGE